MKRMTAGMIVLFTTLALAQVQAQELSAAFAGQARFVTAGSFGFVSDVLVGGNPVKGAPYSAEAVTENIQTLADGNRIVQKSTALLYRDSLGRERREQTLSAIGPFTPQGDPPQIITISDPVAGVNYSLNSKEHVAVKLPALPSGPRPEAGLTRSFEVTVAGPPPATVSVEGGAGPGGAPLVTYHSIGSTGAAPKTEQLGWRVIEGVQAEGARTTITIPAGEMGNERPIDIIDEVWRSPDLQLIVLSKHTDPRMGENIYSLKNVSRAEPPASLFQVPPGYTVREKP